MDKLHIILLSLLVLIVGIGGGFFIGAFMSNTGGNILQDDAGISEQEVEKQFLYEELPIIEQQYGKEIEEKAETVEDKKTALDNNMESDSSLPSWVAQDKDAPWYDGIYVTFSDDEMSFDAGKLIINHSGVPNLLLLDDGTIIAVYQYFSFEDENMYNRMAYSTSDDNGNTWSDPALISINNLPDAKTVPVDPTLVLTEDNQLRLYFTLHKEEDSYASVVSAIQEDGDITQDFEYEEGITLVDENAHLLDPAVIYFNDEWHYYTTSHSERSSLGVVVYHAVSSDGLDFAFEDNIESEMQFLGNPLIIDDALRFYGTANGRYEISSAVSTDGYDWEMEDETILTDAYDPAVVELSDGEYMMLYTSYAGGLEQQ